MLVCSVMLELGDRRLHDICACAACLISVPGLSISGFIVFWKARGDRTRLQRQWTTSKSLTASALMSSIGDTVTRDAEDRKLQSSICRTRRLHHDHLEYSRFRIRQRFNGNGFNWAACSWSCMIDSLQDQRLTSGYIVGSGHP
ncbi:hypothetical protein BDN72DRAFT_527109 [Pluteus cervinus]|uniref:Uncharacterized protein n=1 Tax=Pluteus cervinus TaxID=181527 RepID=A0ACD3A3I4_9AGAR|nr:hypothetical protein BDN72DRAFT_527109 [Pluteus cervinus]